MGVSNIDIIDGSRARSDRKGWAEVTRVATITGLSGSASGMFDAAQDALTAYGVDAGDRHPVHTLLVLDEISWEAIAPDGFRATLTYRRLEGQSSGEPDTPEATQIDVGSSLTSQQVNTNKNGVELTLAHLSPPDGETGTIVATVSAQLPQTNLTFRRRETSSPGNISKDYVGKINLAGWDGDPTAQEGQWMCTAIRGTSNDNMATWDVTYEFAYNIDGWNPWVYWRDSKGKIPDLDDLTVDVGYYQASIYDTANFNNLNLV